MLDLAPYSAHAATTKAKIIPKIIIILSFLYINLLSLFTEVSQVNKYQLACL